MLLITHEASEKMYGLLSTMPCLINLTNLCFFNRFYYFFKKMKGGQVI